MPTFDFVIESRCSQSARARQLESIFDVPRQETARLEFKGDIPFDGTDWNVGLVLGPSGCGKSTIINRVFGGERPLEWGGDSVIDDFSKSFSIEKIAAVCQAVGFNTIPAWLRPFRVLSNGERFRVDLARRLLECDGDIVVDEFTSVVDRQVAKIGAHAVQKYVRREAKRFIAASCHYDIVEWLQPDWTFEPATMRFERRSLRRRPDIDCAIVRAPYESWRAFAPFHYLTANLHRAARCFVLTVNDRPAAFAGMLFRPHPTTRNIMGCSRLVTLPDFQGLGLAFALIDRVAALYSAIGIRTHTYPAHPALIRGFDKSERWRLEKRPGFNKTISQTKGLPAVWRPGARPCAMFEYCGPPASDVALARAATA